MELKSDKNIVELFNRTLNQLESINNENNKLIISKPEFDEQRDNLVDLQTNLEKYSDILDKLDKEKDNKTKIYKLLHDLHLVVGNLSWHVAEIDELKSKLLRNYQEENVDEIEFANR